MRTFAYVLFRDLLYDRWRSLLTLLGLALVAMSYLFLTAFVQAFLAYNQQTSPTSNLVIVAADAVDPMEGSLDESVLQTALQIAPAQIERTFPTLFRHLNIAGQIMQVRAVPLEEMTTSLMLSLLQGRWPTGSREIVVSQGVAQAAGWKVGDMVNIYGADFQMTGLVRAGENNTGAVWMTYPEGQRLFGVQRGFQAGYLRLATRVDPEAARAQLQADPRLAACCTIYLENALSGGYYQVSHNLLTLSNIMALVALLAIIFGAYNATSLSLTERSHEFGLLRIIGFSQEKLRGFLLARMLALTMAAYLLGWVMAQICLLFYRASQPPLGIASAPLVLTLSLSTSLLGLALSGFFAALGVWLTSGQLASLSPLSRSD